MTNTKLSDQWADVLAAPVGHVFLDRFDDGVRFLIMRGPAALCCYVGVPESHPLAGKAHDDIPLSCHGGLTFADRGGDKWPEGFYWYGWDYAHAGDRSTYDDDRRLGLPMRDNDDVRWTPKMVESDAWGAIYEFRKLMRLAESVVAK